VVLGGGGATSVDVDVRQGGFGYDLCPPRPDRDLVVGQHDFVGGSRAVVAEDRKPLDRELDHDREPSHDSDPQVRVRLEKPAWQDGHLIRHAYVQTEVFAVCTVDIIEEGAATIRAAASDLFEKRLECFRRAVTGGSWHFRLPCVGESLCLVRYKAAKRATC